MPEPTTPWISRGLRFQTITLSLIIGLGIAGAPQAFAVDSKASKFYEDALVRYEKKDLDGAIIQLKNALQIDKDILPVQMLLGKALLQNGDAGGAEVALMEALRLGVNRAEIVALLAQAYIGQGKQKLVIEQQQFNPAGLPPGVQFQLLLLRSAASADLGDARSAMKAVEDARAIDSRSPASWLAEVPVRIRARELREASIAAERAIALAPDSAEAWYQKGSVLHVSGNLPATLEAYDRALKLVPNHLEAKVARAGIYLDLGRSADAQKDVDDLKSIAPKEPRAFYLQALLAERDNKPDASRAALRSVVELLDPVPMDFIRYRPQLLMLDGLAHFGLNEREKAKQYLESFQRAQANTPASKLLAQIYAGESNEDRAIVVLETYLKAQPADGQAMTQLASVLISKGQYAKAAALMQQALRTKDSPEFRTVLGMSLIRSGQSANGVAELEAAYKKDPLQTQAAVALVGLYVRSGQAAKAVPIAETLVKQQPSSARLFNLLGMTKADARDIVGARGAFDQALKLDPGFTPVKLNIARLEIASKAYDAAAARLEAILKSDEKNADAMFEMATLAERKGQLADAQRWLEKSNDLSGPKDFRFGLALSEFHLRNGRPSAALEVVKRVSAKGPDDLQVTMAYAKAQLATGDSFAAKSTLASATRLADYNPPLQVQIAVMQLAANNIAGAAYSLDKALSTQPDFLPAMALMADVELRQGDAAKAEKRARDIISQNPRRAVGYSVLGDTLMARSQVAPAIEAYRRAHATEPSTETLLRLFRALSKQDGGKPAAQLAEQWLKTYPRDLAVIKALADGYARNANLGSAKATYETALKISPDDAEVLNNLANVQLRTKDPAAVATAERAMTKAPANAAVIDTLGWALFLNGQTERALPLLRDARLRQPANPEIRYHLASVLAQTGRTTEAREELDAALQAGRIFDQYAEAEKLMKTLK